MRSAARNHNSKRTSRGSLRKRRTASTYTSPCAAYARARSSSSASSPTASVRVGESRCVPAERPATGLRLIRPLSSSGQRNNLVEFVCRTTESSGPRSHVNDLFNSLGRWRTCLMRAFTTSGEVFPFTLTSIVNRDWRSTSVAMWELWIPPIRSPSHCLVKQVR